MAASETKLRLFLSHRAGLIDYATPLVGCRERAEDVVQDAWLRFAGADESAVRQPAAYLYRIVRNLALDWSRRRTAETGCLQADADRSWVADSAEAELVGDQAVAAVTGALRELPPRAKTAFELYRIEGLTQQQIADRLGVSVATTHRLLRAALMAAYQALEHE